MALALVLGATAACDAGAGAQAEPVVDTGLATLTAAAGAADTGGAEEGAGTADVAPGSDTIELAATPDLSGAAGQQPLSPDALQTQMAIAQATERVKYEVADVDALVQAQPPLATFTPGPGSEPEGRLLYVRNGGFYVKDVDGGAAEAVEDVPSVWAPPDDPGRAWTSPDGEQVAFFGGRDAEMWVMDVDGSDPRRLSGPNLPTGAHEVSYGDRSAVVRLAPSQDYTVLLLPHGVEAAALFVDDNSRHVKGEGRLRVIHASEAWADEILEIAANGQTLGRRVGYGQSTGDWSIPMGPLNLEVSTVDGERVGLFRDLSLGERELKTVFLTGSSELSVAPASYEPQQATSGASRVRVFNPDASPADVRVDGAQVLASDLAPGALSAYAAVPAVASRDELSDIQRSMYGLVTGRAPVTWSPDGRRIAFQGAGDGQPDLYVAPADGEARRVSNNTGQELFPAWSPDGASLAWITLDPAFFTHELHVMGPGGDRGVPLDLTPVQEVMGAAPGAQVQVPAGPGWVDDDTLFFYPTVDGASAGIWTAEADGSLSRVFDAPVEDPTWSDGAAAWVTATSDGDEVFVVEPDGGAWVIATGAAHAPLWSPDGRLVSWVEGEATSSDGWAIHVVDAGGDNDRRLTDFLPLVQESPPVPGPDAKRFWLDEGRSLAFTVVGRDYGAADRSGGTGARAGDDIENLWIVPTDGSAPPRRATDLVQVFYMKGLEPAGDGEAVGLVGFSYLDRSQKLWALRPGEGGPVPVDSDVRWFAWLP